MDINPSTREFTEKVQKTIEGASGDFKAVRTLGQLPHWRHLGIRNLVMRVERDPSGHDVLLVGAATNPDELFAISDVIQCWASEWDSQSDLAKRLKACADQAIRYAQDPNPTGDPPSPVLELEEALKFVMKHAKAIDAIFAPKRIEVTRSELHEARRQLLKKMGFDWEPIMEAFPEPARLAAQSVDPF